MPTSYNGFKSESLFSVSNTMVAVCRCPPINHYLHGTIDPVNSWEVVGTVTAAQADRQAADSTQQWLKFINAHNTHKAPALFTELYQLLFFAGVYRDLGPQ